MTVQIALALPASSATHSVYKDSLASNWVNWSWDVDVNLNAIEDGHKSLAFTPTKAWAGFYLHSNESIKTSNYKYLSFALKTPAKSSSISAYVYDSNYQKHKPTAIDAAMTGAAIDGWQQFNISLENMDATNIDLGGFVLQTPENIQSTSYLRNVIFSSTAVDVQEAAVMTEPAHITAPVNDTTTEVVNQNVLELEKATLAANTGSVFADASASNAQGLLIWSNASASISQNSTTPVQLISVTAKADYCGTAAKMDIYVDGAKVGGASVDTATWETYKFPVAISTGLHIVQIAFTNDTWTNCDLNLRLDKVQMSSDGTPIAVAQPTPIIQPIQAVITQPTATLSQTLYVDPNSPASAQAAAWRQSRPVDASLMDRLANQSTAKWFGNWSGNVGSSVDTFITAANGSTPVLVSYNIPYRDCGSYSANSTSEADYKTWISQFAGGIKNRSAIVILEPDALALDECLSAERKAARYSLLTSAVTQLTKAGAKVYIDAGHAGWIAPNEMAKRLSSSGITSAAGFSLNVSNFGTTTDQVTYGTSLSKYVNGKHFVIDTSRNGSGSNGEWCNPTGRTIGETPKIGTSNPLVDAHLWIKTPGESDGQCNGGPAAGQWWPEYALSLLR